MDYTTAIENFVRYSVRYQVLLAQHVANICNTKVYIFDINGFFDHTEDTKVEVIDGVGTISKQGKRAVLSVAVKESFQSNKELFLKFVDENVALTDKLGLYVIAPLKVDVEKVDVEKVEVEKVEVEKAPLKVEEKVEEKVEVNDKMVEEFNLKNNDNLDDIKEAVEKLEFL
jgi:hypothetical protein